MAQVLPAREFSDPLLQLVLRTFLRSFPNAYLFNTGGPGDYVILGSRAELVPEFERWEERLGSPEVLADLAEINVRDLLGLLALQSHSRETLTGFAGGGEVNTDNRPILENAGPPALFAGRKSEVLSLLDERRGAGRRLFIAGYLKRHRPGSENLRAAAELFRTGDARNPPLFFSALREYLYRAPGDLKAWHLLSDELLRAGRNQEALDALEQAWKVAGGVEGAELKILRQQAATLVPSERESLTPLSAEAAFARSREILERCLSLDAANHDLYYFELAKLSILEADGKTAAGWLKRAADYRRKNAALRSSAITDGEVEELLRRAEGR
jgi:hypothetical protein